ncbi:MAG: LamG-like jellyroll fold domain-containing protein [Candidatus Woesearchaeota archaeon]
MKKIKINNKNIKYKILVGFYAFILLGAILLSTISLTPSMKTVAAENEVDSNNEHIINNPTNNSNYTNNEKDRNYLLIKNVWIEKDPSNKNNYTLYSEILNKDGSPAKSSEGVKVIYRVTKPDWTTEDILVNHNYQNKEYKEKFYWGTSFNLCGHYNYKITAIKNSFSTTKEGAFDIKCSHGDNTNNLEARNEPYEQTINHINVYLNQKFTLVENQTAIVLDYKNMNIKLYEIQDSVLTKTNSEPSVKIGVGFQSDKDSITGITTSPGLILILKKGETRDFSGLEITVLDINEKSATFILKNKIYLTDYIDIGIDPRIKIVKQGEMAEYSIILQDNHEAEKCEYQPVTTFPNKKILGEYQINLNEVKVIDNSFELELVEIDSDSALINYVVKGFGKAWPGYTGKQKVKQGDSFEIKNPYAFYKVTFNKISNTENSVSTANLGKVQGYIVLTVYKTKIVESTSEIKCIKEDNQYTYNINIIGLPFESIFEKKVVLKAGEKKIIKLSIDTNKFSKSDSIKETISEIQDINDEIDDEIVASCISLFKTGDAYEKCVIENRISQNSSRDKKIIKKNQNTAPSITPDYYTYKFAVKVVQESGYGKDVAYATLSIIPKQTEVIKGYAVIDVYKYIYPGDITIVSNPTTIKNPKITRNADQNFDEVILDMDFDNTGTNPNEIIDKSGKNNNGKNINANFVEGKEGKALNFEADVNTQYNNGQGKSVLIADSDTFNLKTFSIEASIKPANNLKNWPRGYQTIISKEHQYILRFAKDYNTGQHYLQGVLFNEEGIKGINYPIEENTFEAGKWYDIKFSYDGNYLRLYINGAQVQEVYSPISKYKPVYSNAYVIIGNHNVGINYDVPSQTYQFIGAIDNIKIRGIKTGNYTEPTEPPTIIEPFEKIYLGRYTLKLGETTNIPSQNSNVLKNPTVFKLTLEKIYKNNIGLFGISLSNTGSEYGFKLYEGESYNVPDSDYIIVLKDIAPDQNGETLIETTELPKEIITIRFDKGWNLISSSGSNIYKFISSSCDNNDLKGFIYLKNEKKFVTLVEAEKILGNRFSEYLINNAFWVYSFKECSIKIEVEKYSKYSDLNLESGWNLIPVSQDMIRKTLNTITSNCDIERAYLFNTENQKWERINNDYIFSKETDLYKGIAIKSKNYCELSGIIIYNPPNFPE